MPTEPAGAAPLDPARHPPRSCPGRHRRTAPPGRPSRRTPPVSTWPAAFAWLDKSDASPVGAGTQIADTLFCLARPASPRGCRSPNLAGGGGRRTPDRTGVRRRDPVRSSDQAARGRRVPPTSALTAAAGIPWAPKPVPAAPTAYTTGRSKNLPSMAATIALPGSLTYARGHSTAGARPRQ